MSTIGSLIDYCSIDNPVGALLLTGEWGCGKTYLVENDLKNELKGTHLIIRVSLFGVPSIEELHKAVKSEWLNEKDGVFERIAKAGKFRKTLENAKDLISDTRFKSVAGTLLSVDFMDFVEVKNKIDDKKVVLVFDDLERSKLTTSEKLGVINEYCENQHFNVIIVADEEKLKDDSYKDIKEKVVQRTIHHTSEYASVVSSIIASETDKDYKGFLEERKREITALIAGTDLEGKSLDDEAIKQINSSMRAYGEDYEKTQKRRLNLLRKRPHNIRILKSAIQDFKRVFTILKVKDVGNRHKWLYAFLSFSMAAKANLINDDDSYGKLYYYPEVGILYPGFYDIRFMPELLMDWILDGVFDEDEIAAYIEEHYGNTEHATPLDLVKNTRIDYLEENVAREGLQKIIGEAYEGALTLNEYEVFIINSKLARQYDLIKLEIDWNKVLEGINKRIEQNIADGEPKERYSELIGDLTDYSEDEKKAYSLIVTAGKSSIMIEQNRREYVRLMNEAPYDVFILLANKRFNSFDHEMADATTNAFKAVDNPTKAQFPGYFEGMWGHYASSFDISKDGVEKTKRGFEALKRNLIELCVEYSDQPFKKKYTEVFIEVVEGLVSKTGNAVDV